MQPKRKAAANVFMEQNVVQQAAADALEQREDLSPAPPVPPPSEAGFVAFAPAPSRARGLPQLSRSQAQSSGLKTSEELQLEKEPIRVRETGIWPFKRVIVPPNVYVVHTRIGRKEPLTLGLGLSFRYNPNTDAYLVVPAAMQTIGIVANCISKEKQGINILAYVQWQINDFSVAYRRLDFSDQRDPLGIVNAQLREQAEAAIKDKIATMSVEEVLTDKEPIIEELTTRLKAVAEGRGASEQDLGEGLGIKIVTVQLKEALVSSQRLWEHLQAPFRYEQEKTARISYLLAQDEIRRKELQNRQLAETGEAETLVEIERIKQSKQTEALEIRLAQESVRSTREQEDIRHKIQIEEQTALIRQESEQRLQMEAAKVEQEAKLATLNRTHAETVERARLEAETNARRKVLQVEQALQELAEENRLAVSRLQADQQRLERETTLKKLEADFRLLTQEQDDLLQRRAQEASLERTQQEQLIRLRLEEAANQARIALAEKEVAIARLQQEVRNMITERELAGRLIDRLPEIAAHMPEVHELKVFQSGDGAFDALSAFLSRIVALGEDLGLPIVPRLQRDKA